MKDLNNEWARSQIEAAAEGSLSPSDRARFDQAVAADASLERAVQRAVRLQLELARMRASRVPPGLWRSLLAIPKAAGRPAVRAMRPLIAGVGAAVAAVALTVLLKPTPPASLSEEQVRALADFELAMSYLKQSTEIAQAELSMALGGALQRALAGNHDADRDERSRSDTGD